MRDIVVYEKTECIDCTHRHNKELELCDEYVINRGLTYDKHCDYNKEAEVTIKLVICSKCRSIAEMCKCVKPKMTSKIV